MMVSRLAVAPLLALSLTFSGLALAAPTAADKETARGLMNEGRAARDKGDLKAALKAFAAADALMHVPTTGLELARAQQAIGQLVEARDTALRVTRSPEQPGEPAPFKAARDAASTLADDLGARIPSLTVDVKNVPDGVIPKVAIDGADVPAEVLGQPRKLNPGHHVITAKAGTADGKQEVDLAEKDSKEIAIELPAQAAAPPSDKGAQEQAAPEAPPEAPSHGSKLLIFGGFGLAGAGLIAGSVTGLMAMSKANDIKGQCIHGGTVCPPSVDGDLSSAKTMANISTVSFIVAGVGAALGVTGFFVGGGSPEARPADAPAPDAAPDPKESRLRVVPWVGLGSAGVTGSF